MYKDAEQQTKDLKLKKDDNIKLGKVTVLTSGGMPKIAINGSNSESVKVYPCLNSYKPKVGDTVLLQKQGITYVILGAVENESLANNEAWAPVDHRHDDLYAALNHNHDAAYATKNHNHDTAYAAKTHSHTEYAASSHTHDLIKATGTSSSTNIQVKLEYVSNGAFSGASGATSTNTRRYNGALTPNSNESYVLGTNTSKWIGAWITNIFGTYLGSTASKYTSAYITTMYGTVTNQSSDRRIKTNIADLGSKFKALFNKLRPVSFKFTDGSSDKTHTGFIAQEVEGAIDEVGLNDLGIVAKDEGGNYYLNYIEFIAIQTQMIQELQGKVEKLEKKIAEMENDNK